MMRPASTEQTLLQEDYWIKRRLDKD